MESEWGTQFPGPDPLPKGWKSGKRLQEASEAGEMEASECGGRGGGIWATSRKSPGKTERQKPRLQELS